MTWQTVADQPSELGVVSMAVASQARSTLAFAETLLIDLCRRFRD